MRRCRPLLALTALTLLLSATPAQAAPVHPFLESKAITGLNHACGVAVDSKGDVYASSAGTGEVKVYDSSHTLLTSISDAHEPCGLAVTTTGNLYVSEKATGEVARFKPNAYPFAGTPTYGSREVIDSSTKAKGIAVDRFDSRLYVAEGDHIAIYKADGSFEANAGEGSLVEATGVSAYTNKATVSESPVADRYLWVADGKGVAADQLSLFIGLGAKALTLRRELKGANTPSGSFGFGTAGAYLAADPGNGNSEGKCVAVAAQACSAGHLFLYDALHEALDEFDASGEYLDQVANASFADAEPTAVAIDRSGGASDGTLYVTAGAGAGARALAFGPLKAPSRKTLKKPTEEAGGLSQELKGARATATDTRGNAYVRAESEIHIYSPSGIQITSFKDEGKPYDMAVDSTGKVYVLDENGGFSDEAEVTYYTPSTYPPVSGTTYTRRVEPIVVPEEFPAADRIFKAIAVNPGPGPGKDHLFVAAIEVIHEYDSAANGSGLLNGEFAKGLSLPVIGSLAVYGANGNVYVAGNPHLIVVVNAAGTEVIARIEDSGSPTGTVGDNPAVAIDQSNGHILEFGETKGARDYDSSGAFIAEFGNFTNAVRPYRVAVDSSCALHEPPLTGSACESFDPANGVAYVAYDDPSLTHPPYDLNAFGPLSYGKGSPVALTGIADSFGPGSATLHGTVDPEESLLEECTFEYLTDAEYQENLEDEDPAFEGAESEECAESPAEIGEGSNPVPVHSDVNGFDLEAPYRFRLVAKNTGGTGEGDDALFGPPSLTEKNALPVLYHEATLRTEVNPTGLATEYRFDYVDLESFEEQGGFEGLGTHHSAWGKLEPGEAKVPVSAALTGLSEGTEYRYRAVAKNAVTLGEEVEGATQSFVTQARLPVTSCPNAAYRFGLSSNLPDCRAYELVTPGQTDGLNPYAADDGNSDSVGFSNWLTVQRGEGAGERLSYFTEGTLPGFEGNGRLDGYRADRGAGEHPEGGWQSNVFSPDFAESAPGTHHFALQHGIASDQLYSLWESNPEPETFPPDTLPKGVYLRTPVGEANEQCNDPGVKNHQFELIGCGSVEVGGKTDVRTDPDALSRYVSAGGAHTIFTSRAQLAPDAPPAPTEAIYDRAAGSASARVVSAPPEGASAEELAEFQAAVFSKEPATYLGASEDGTAVAFSAGSALYANWDGSGTEAAGPTTARVGEELSCSEGPLQGVKDVNLHFQWLRNSVPIGGANGSGQAPTKYTTVGADAGKAIQCLVFVFEDGTGSVSVSRSIPIEPISGTQPPQPPAAIAAPTPSAPQVGTVESCNPGSWVGADTLSYQWYGDGEAIPGATAATYEVKAGDVPGAIQCVVIGSNVAATIARASAITETNPAPSKPAPVASATATPRTTYAGLSDDGGRFFYALGNGVAPGRLFSFDLETRSATEIAPDSIFVAVSPDGSHAFFTSEEALAEPGDENDNGEHALDGEHNLYAWDGSGIRFVGILSAEDFEHEAFAKAPGMNLAAWTTAIGPTPDSGRSLAPIRSTPDGSAIVFQSHARLTAYDNEGVGEIYRYDPSAEAGERLLCVSCDRSGASPSADALLEDIRNGVGSPIDTSTMVTNVTDDGKEVFFQSFDRLLPEDANEAEDVYEWMAMGTGQCERHGGCLALISSGQGETPSTLYAMSAKGQDVFFHTKERLVGADAEGSPSIYDARVGGGIPEPEVREPCQGDACQPQGSEPPVLPSPASTGAGESSDPKPPPSGKGKHRVKGRCVKRHSKKHHRRAKHNRRTHR
jgi:hypothetical protein